MREGKSTGIKKRYIIPYLFILPAFIIHMCVVTGPALSTLVMSMFDWNGLGNAKFIGLNNFKEIFQDPLVKMSLIHNVEWLLIFITVPLFLGFVIAILVSQLKKSQMFFRTIYFVPYVISAAVAGKIWTAYMNPYYGVNQVFANLGWTKLAKTLWLGNPKIALYAVAFVDNWHWWGFVLVLMLSALHQVDTSLYEVAKTEGANAWQTLIHVTIPQIKPTIISYFVFVIIAAFTTFDYVWIMTQGGPAGSTEVFATRIYKTTFINYDAGYGAAMSLSVCILALSVYFVLKFIQKRGRE